LPFFSGVSILLGILRDRLLATFVGVGPVLDVYNASFRIPDLLYASILAFVTAGTVVPFLTKEDKHGHNIDPRHKLSSITLFFGGFMAIVGTLVAVTLPLYAHAIVPGFSQTELTQFIATTRLLLIQPIFLGIISLISCFAQMKNEFFWTVFVATNVSKHYFADTLIKEGNVYGVTKLELKGVHLIASAIDQDIVSRSQALIKEFNRAVSNNEPVDIRDYIDAVADIEIELLGRIKNGDVDIYKRDKIKEPGSSFTNWIL
jgi:hypothetical protein